MKTITAVVIGMELIQNMNQSGPGFFKAGRSGENSGGYSRDRERYRRRHRGSPWNCRADPELPGGHWDPDFGDPGTSSRY